MIVVGNDIEQAFNRLELLEKITSLCVRFPIAKSLSSPFLQSLGFFGSSDMHFDPHYQRYYDQITSYSRRAYEHVADVSSFDSSILCLVSICSLCEMTKILVYSTQIKQDVVLLSGQMPP